MKFYRSYRKLTDPVTWWRKKTRVKNKEITLVAKRLKARAARLARKHRAYIMNVAKLLVVKGTLTGEDIPQLRKRRAQAARVCGD
jgi:hypothetical protein